MKFISLILCAICCLLLGCKPISQIIEVTESRQSFEFEPQTVTQQNGGLTFSITPIDAPTLNDLWLTESLSDGSYVKIYQDIKLERQPDEKAEETISMKREIAQHIESEQKKGNIPFDVATQLILRLFYKENQFGENDYSEYISQFNPYKNGRKYLSTFKLVAENSDKIVKSVKLNDIVVNYEDEQFYPYSTQYIESEIAQKKLAIENLHKFNLPDSLRILPNTKTKKYFAIPSLAPKNSELTINIISSQKPVTFSFKTTFHKEEKKVRHKQYHIASSHDHETGFVYYVVKYGTNILPVFQKTASIPEEYWNKPVTVYGIYRGSKGFLVSEKQQIPSESKKLSIKFQNFIRYSN